MKMTKNKLDAFCEMMNKELDKLGCSISYKTDTAVNKTDVDIYHLTLGPKHYLVQWDEVRSLTEAAVPILVDIKTRLNSEVKNDLYKFRNSLTKTNYNTVSNERQTKIDTEIVFKHRTNALVALSNLENIFDRYGVVSVGDLYDMADIKCDYTYSRFGWRNYDDIHGAKILKVKGGYMIDLPEPIEFE